MVGSMTTLDTTDAVPLDPVRAGPETPWEPPLAGTATENLDRGPYGELWGHQGADDSGSWNVQTGSAAPEELSALYDRSPAPTPR